MLKIIEHFTATEFETDRDGNLYFFNNLKVWLILLIIIANFSYPAEDINWFYKGMFMIAITLPMPAFNFVAGYFAKSIIDKETGRFKFEQILHSLILYLFMSLAIFAVDFFLLKEVNSYKFFEPANPQWYLFSLIFWYATIPIINHIKPKYVMIGSILLALLVGMDPTVGDFFALSRIICYFPFFIAAYYLSQDTIIKLLSFGGNYLRTTAFLLLVAFIIFCIWDPLNYQQWKQIVQANCPYEAVPALGDMYNLTGCIARSLWFVEVFAIIMAIMLIVPRSKTCYSYIGTKTLQIFILHTIIVRFLIYAGLYELVESTELWLVICLHIIFAFAFLYLFALKPFQAPYDMVMAWKFERIFVMHRRSN